MSGFGDIMSTVAAIEASEAADNAAGANRAAKRARDAAEEKLEGSAGNKLIKLRLLDVEEINDTAKLSTMSFFARLFDEVPKKDKVVSYGTYGIKLSDISHLAEVTICGRTYTKVYFEERCNIPERWLLVEESIDEVSKLMER